jgi:anti-sigma factor RsiW
MSACDSQFAQRIQAYHDGRLDDAQAAQVEAHLKSCAACAAELRELEGLSQMLASIPAARLSQIGLARVHNAVDTVMADEGGVLKLARWLSAAAAIVLAAATITLTSLSSQSAQAQSSDVPQPWEQVAMTGDATASAQQSSNVVDAEWIVADLSRRTP